MPGPAPSCTLDALDSDSVYIDSIASDPPMGSLVVKKCFGKISI